MKHIDILNRTEILFIFFQVPNGAKNEKVTCKIIHTPKQVC